MSSLDHIERPKFDILSEHLNDVGITLDIETANAARATVARLARSFNASVSSSSEKKLSHRTKDGTKRGTPQQAATAQGRARPLSPELPPTIKGLRTWLQHGRISIAEALDLQKRIFVAGDKDVHSAARFCSWAAPDTVDAPLAGIGLAHKDNISNGQFAPGNGLQDTQRADTVIPRAPVLTRLDKAGATQLAALVMAERACGATAENHHYPDVINPLDDTLFVGGSSSGSAAAIAAGFCYGSLGTDTAGSIRIPAASCGLLGLKPSRGVLSSEGVTPLAASLDTVGLMTRSASDLLTLYQAASGTCSITLPDVDSLRITNCLDFHGMSAHVAPVLEQFVAVLGGMVQLQSQPLQLERKISLYGETIFYFEAGRSHGAALQTHAASMNVVARQLCAQGLMLPTDWYLRAQKERPMLREAFIRHHFSQADLLLMPAFTISVPERRQVTFGSPDFDAATLLEVFRWMMPANFLDLPALVMPVGTDALGRPVSIQILGQPGAEPALMALATQFEMEHGDARGLFSLGAPHMQP